VPLNVRTSVARISYLAAPARITYAAFSEGTPQELAQRHEPQQEIRDTWDENAFLQLPLHSGQKAFDRLRLSFSSHVRWCEGHPERAVVDVE
jgi:hypothetical protein